MPAVIYLNDNVCLEVSQVEKLCERVLKEIESGLPAGGRTKNAYTHILDECKEKLDSKIIVL